jgi:hypothetical protein
MTDVSSCPSCGAELPTGAVDQIRDRPANDREQAARDQDQTRSDRDQTASDHDQTWSDRDQTASDQDQRSADEDQQAADDDFAAGGDAVTYHRSALAREQSSHDRGTVSFLRDEGAAARLGTAEDRRLPRFAIAARSVVMSSLVWAIYETTRAQVGRAFFCGPRAIGRARPAIGPRQPTTVPGPPPTARRQPVNVPRRSRLAANLQTA